MLPLPLETLQWNSHQNLVKSVSLSEISQLTNSNESPNDRMVEQQKYTLQQIKLKLH